MQPIYQEQQANFSGSYQPDDVTFLLKPIEMKLSLLEEALIPSGRRHYAEMVSVETPPDAEGLRVFHEALVRNRRRLARDLVQLAHALCKIKPREITLLSLARAGTPIGVILRRVLLLMGREVKHYSISIIRDRGIDTAALDYVLKAGHPPESITFIDGWTGKGAATTELYWGIKNYNACRQTKIEPDLYVACDLAGTASLAATAEDYLIPSSVLKATISGLLSLSILNDEYVKPGDFHACIFYPHLKQYDLSSWFVDEVLKDVNDELQGNIESVNWDLERRLELSKISQNFLADIMERFRLGFCHQIKPGISEATRAVILRHVVERVIVRDPDDEDTQPIILLANAKNIPITIEQIPYRAVTLIKMVG